MTILMNILYDRGHSLTISYVKECLLFILTKAKRKNLKLKKKPVQKRVCVYSIDHQYINTLVYQEIKETPQKVNNVLGKQWSHCNPSKKFKN